ncbi:hypothetical protein J2W51_003043 [Tardiphaga robiniae]|uniref:hypothetical protein n=1 Tax=Tardiphaga robiniae TaxID=943830 RepID=UPI00285F1D6C|nr:hypothetical protein [Tardiphaga robiniae]MDR6660473.1 hypothetical protein [Tardiphaga robiniae]
MLVRLTRVQRLRAGWFVALAYLLCVLAPTISFALPGQHPVAPCLTGESNMAGMVHVNSSASAHMHGDGHAHDHSVAHASAAHSAAAHADGNHALTAIDDASGPQKVPHSPSGPCCGLMCISALPAPLTDIVTPSVPTVLRVTEGYRAVTDSAPARLYRPPIS